MASDAAVEAVVEAISARLHQTTDLWTHQQYRPAMTADGSSVQEAATAILDALPDLLREDSAAGQALRERLGLKRWYVKSIDHRCWLMSSDKDLP